MTTLLILAGVALAVWLLLHAGTRLVFHAPRTRETGSPADLGLTFEDVTFRSVRGKHLRGWLIPADGPGPHPTVALLHGWGANAQDMLPLVPALHERGWSVLTFAARNHGRSDDDGFSAMPKFAEDMAAALDWLRAHPGVDGSRLVAAGHSVGAAATLLAASRRDDLAAVIALSSFAHPGELMHRYLTTRGLAGPAARLVVRYVEWAIGHRLDAIAPVATVAGLRCPVLIGHGAADESIPLADAERIAAANPRARLVVLDGVDHVGTERLSCVAAAMADFLEPLRGPMLAPADRPQPPATGGPAACPIPSSSSVTAPSSSSP